MHELPLGFMFERVVRSIGSRLGDYLESDLRNLARGRKAYMHIRVALNVNKPLQSCIPIKKIKK